MIKKIIFVLATIGLVYFSYSWGSKKSFKKQIEKQAEKQTEPTAETEVNKEFEFPIEGEKEKLKFSITEAKKVKLISMQSKPIKAESGKEFLVLSIEIENNLAKKININSQNYLRLIGEGEKKYAPDFYNEMIEVPALSVKRDELGFIVPADQNHFKLLVGPIEKEGKEEIEINL